MMMGQDLDKVENFYDTVAREYAETFSGEHEKKPKDQEMLRRFSMEIGDRKPIWGELKVCGPFFDQVTCGNMSFVWDGSYLAAPQLIVLSNAFKPKITAQEGLRFF